MTNYKNYNEGDLSPASGVVIKKIIRMNDFSIVYFNKEGSLVYEFEASFIKVSLDALRSKFTELDSKVPSDVTRESAESLRHELGCSLFSALCCADNETAVGCFDSIADKLKRVKSAEVAKLLYLVNSASIGVALLILVLILYFLLSPQESIIDEVILCMGCGVTGSLFSSLQKKWAHNINLLSPNWAYTAQASIQLLLGAISGIVVYLSSKGDIALGFAKNDIFVLLFFCIVAGFSERFGPNLLIKAESENT